MKSIKFVYFLEYEVKRKDMNKKRNSQDKARIAIEPMRRPPIFEILIRHAGLHAISQA